MPLTSQCLYIVSVFIGKPTFQSLINTDKDMEGESQDKTTGAED